MAFVNLFLICVLAAGVGVKREAQDKVYKFVSTQPPTSAPAAMPTTPTAAPTPAPTCPVSTGLEIIGSYTGNCKSSDPVL